MCRKFEENEGVCIKGYIHAVFDELVSVRVVRSDGLVEFITINQSDVIPLSLVRELVSDLDRLEDMLEEFQGASIDKA